jgi:DNA-binding Lrp family transcriptional regulator
MRAYLLLKVTPQNTMGLMHSLKDNDHIVEASLIHGPYDCLAVIQGKDLDEINQIVLDVRNMPGIAETSTHLIIQSWQRSAG